jgi:hypothetical protein
MPSPTRSPTSPVFRGSPSRIGSAFDGHRFVAEAKKSKMTFESEGRGREGEVFGEREGVANVTGNSNNVCGGEKFRKNSNTVQNTTTTSKEKNVSTASTLKTNVSGGRTENSKNSKVNTSTNICTSLKSHVQKPLISTTIHVMSFALMLAILVEDLQEFRQKFPDVHFLRSMGFLSRWTVLLEVIYLGWVAALAVYEMLVQVGGVNPSTVKPSNHFGSKSSFLYYLHRVALPASIACVPLYWAKLVSPDYQRIENSVMLTSFSSTFGMHGVSALVMLLDFVMISNTNTDNTQQPDSSAPRISSTDRAIWRCGCDEYYVTIYGICNMVFMFLYFHACGCPEDKDWCMLKPI